HARCARRTPARRSSPAGLVLLALLVVGAGCEAGPAFDRPEEAPAAEAPRGDSTSPEAGRDMAGLEGSDPAPPAGGGAASAAEAGGVGRTAGPPADRDGAAGRRPAGARRPSEGSPASPRCTESCATRSAAAAAKSVAAGAGGTQPVATSWGPGASAKVE